MASDARASSASSAVAYARGMVAGLLVAIPVLATMEMWWLGFHMPPWKMLLLLAVGFVGLVLLEYYSGFRRYARVNLLEEVRDAVSALGIGLLVSATVLAALNLLRPSMSMQEIVGKTILQSIPVSLGVSVAVARLGERDPQAEKRQERSGFWGIQAMGLLGGLLFAFNVAPTTEPMVLGMRISWWHGLLIMALSLVQVHAIVYYVNFRGSTARQPRRSAVRAWLGDSATTYALSLLLSLYLLWTFGRVGVDTGFMVAVHMTVVLGYVTSLGAAAGKLIL